MNTNLPTTAQNAKVALAKTKNLMDITNKILASRSKALTDILFKKPYVSLGHIGSVHSVAFSPDGMTVLSSGSWDKTLKLWDIRSGKCIRTFEGHTDSVTSVAFSPDGMTVLSGSDDGTIKLWDTRSGECIRTFVEYFCGGFLRRMQLMLIQLLLVQMG